MYWTPSTAVRSALAMAIAACALTGCASLSKRRVDESVVAARQLSLQGIEAMQHGQFTEAETLFGMSLEKCPLDERTRRHYAQMLWRRGEREQAVAHMEEAVRLSGGVPAMLVELGDMYFESNDLARAEQQADLAIAGNRQLAAAWALKGDVLRRRGQADLALAKYHRALAYREHYPRAQFALAEIYRSTGEHARCLSTLQSLADGYPPDQVPARVLFEQGLALKELARPDSAIECFLAARAKGDHSPNLLCHLAETQMLAGDPTNARLTASAATNLATQRGTTSPQLDERLASLQQRLSLTGSPPADAARR